MITVISSSSSSHQLSHQSALIEGLEDRGIICKADFPTDKINTRFVACWGWRIGRSLRAKGHEVLVMERGYLGDRFKYTSLGWNGLNGHAEFPEYLYDNGKRFLEHNIAVKPWKTSGEYALILGQVPGDQSLQGKDMRIWYEEKAKEIIDYYDIPVHFRPHPEAVKRGIAQPVPRTIASQGTLGEALSGAKFTVCYNSNSSVDSLLNGVPCIVGDKGSMVYDLCGKDISDIKYTEREKPLHRLAQTQWTIDEIKSGEALVGIEWKIRKTLGL